LPKSVRSVRQPGVAWADVESEQIITATAVVSGIITGYWARNGKFRCYLCYVYFKLLNLRDHYAHRLPWHPENLPFSPVVYLCVTYFFTVTTLSSWHAQYRCSMLPMTLPEFCRTLIWITEFKKTLRLSSSRARLTQYTHFHPTPLGYILMLSSYFWRDLPSGFWLSGFPTVILCVFFFSPMRTPFTAPLISPSLFTRIISDAEYKSRFACLCSFLTPPVTSSPLGSNILLSTLFSNILSLCFGAMRV